MRLNSLIPVLRSFRSRLAKTCLGRFALDTAADEASELVRKFMQVVSSEKGDWEMNQEMLISKEATSDARVDMKLEVVVIPVSDVNRAKEFYRNLGWRLDADFPLDNGFRVVQFTPPRSGCSVQFGTKTTWAAPGSAHGLYLIVSDVEAAR